MISIDRRRTIFLNKLSDRFKKYGEPAVEECINKELINISNFKKRLDRYKPLPTPLFHLYYFSSMAIPSTPFLIHLSPPHIGIPLSTLIVYLGLKPFEKPIIKSSDYQELNGAITHYYYELSNARLIHQSGDQPYLKLGKNLYPLPKN